MKNFLLLFVLIFSQISAQKITFISAKSKNAVPNITIFDNSGKQVAISNLNGGVEKSLLNPSGADFTLVLNSRQIGTLRKTDLDGDFFPVEDDVVEIKQVVIKGKNISKYIAVTGNFVTYVVSNNFLQAYSDGIATYFFSNKSKKLEGVKILQYRFYAMKDNEQFRKKVETADFRTFAEMPNLKEIKDIQEYKNSKNFNVAEAVSGENTFVNVERKFLTDKPFKIFGYEFFDFQRSSSYTFITDLGKNLRGLTKFDSQVKMNIKHKSEQNFTKIVNYATFYPTEVHFTDDAFSKKNHPDYDRSS